MITIPFFTRTRLAIALRIHTSVLLFRRSVHMWNLPEKSIAPAPQGAMGTGATYLLACQGRDTDHSLIIRQAYLDFPRVVFKGLSAESAVSICGRAGSHIQKQIPK